MVNQDHSCGGLSCSPLNHGIVTNVYLPLDHLSCEKYQVRNCPMRDGQAARWVDAVTGNYHETITNIIKVHDDGHGCSMAKVECLRWKKKSLALGSSKFENKWKDISMKTQGGKELDMTTPRQTIRCKNLQDNGAGHWVF